MPRKRIGICLAVLSLVGLFSGALALYLNQATQASFLKEPVYQGNSGKKAVAITVNVDWGEEFIPGMLKAFQEHEAKASFFVTGTWAQKNPELLKNMLAQGHSIQNHGSRHIHFASLSAARTAEEIKKAEDIIFNITGHKTTFFAPPYGEQNRQVMQGVQSLNYDLVMWSADTIDWQRPAPETIIKRVMNKVHNDAIILMHPTEPTLKALPELLKKLGDEGYKMVTIEQILVKKDPEQ